MVSIPKYTHQDVAAFIEDGSVPEDLSCNLMFTLVCQPVRIVGDTADRLYDAPAACRALELCHKDPFNRAPITALSALEPDAARQADMLQFRAMVLGYTKVAANLAEMGQSWHLGPPLLPRQSPNPPTLRKIVAGQVIRNAFIRRIATRPVNQPRLARFYDKAGVATSDRALEALVQAKKSLNARLNSAKEVAKKADEVADKTLPVKRWPAFTFGNPQEEAWREIDGRGIDAARLATEFGPRIPEAVAKALVEPSAEVLQEVYATITSSHQTLSDALLAQDGAFLRCLLEDRAYKGLAKVAPFLPIRGSSAWMIAPVGTQYRYLGQHCDGRAEGLGLMVGPSGSLYAGQWTHGRQHGPGRQESLSKSAAGTWHQGIFTFGTATHENGTVVKGTFGEGGLQGYGVTTFANGTEQHWGTWVGGDLVEGKIEAPGLSVKFLRGLSPGEQSLGRVKGTSPECRVYFGTLLGGIPHGLGAMEDGAGVMTIGRWNQGEPFGPGSRELFDRVQYGTWHETNGFVVEEEELRCD